MTGLARSALTLSTLSVVCFQLRAFKGFHLISVYFPISLTGLCAAEYIVLLSKDIQLLNNHINSSSPNGTPKALVFQCFVGGGGWGIGDG